MKTNVDMMIKLSLLIAICFVCCISVSSAAPVEAESQHSSHLKVKRSPYLRLDELSTKIYLAKNKLGGGVIDPLDIGKRSVNDDSEMQLAVVLYDGIIECLNRDECAHALKILLNDNWKPEDLTHKSQPSMNPSSITVSFLLWCKVCFSGDQIPPKKKHDITDTMRETDWVREINNFWLFVSIFFFVSQFHIFSWLFTFRIYFVMINPAAATQQYHQHHQHVTNQSISQPPFGLFFPTPTTPISKFLISFMYSCISFISLDSLHFSLYNRKLNKNKTIPLKTQLNHKKIWKTTAKSGQTGQTIFWRTGLTSLFLTKMMMMIFSCFLSHCLFKRKGGKHVHFLLNRYCFHFGGKILQLE